MSAAVHCDAFAGVAPSPPVSSRSFPEARSRRPLTVRSVFTLGMTLLLSGCGASLSRGVLSNDLGRGTRRDIATFVREILYRHGYVIQQVRETSNTIYYETAWMRREPFEDEAARGAEESRSRIIVEARKGGAETFSVRLRAENTALVFQYPGEWRPMAATEMFRDHVREISNAIRMEIDAGVRVR